MSKNQSFETVEDTIRYAKGLLKYDGVKDKGKIDGKKYKAKIYEDPFGTGFVIICGRIKGKDYKRLTVQLPDETYLMSVKLWDDGGYEVEVFDTDISWTWSSLLGTYYNVAKRCNGD